MIPDHASLVPVEELNRRMWRARLEQIAPAERAVRATALALENADDAARLVLELAPLQEEISMPRVCWDYWSKVLGTYCTTVPTGVRIGKRWCRKDKDGFWIGEYVAPTSTKGTGFASICWRKVVVT